MATGGEHVTAAGEQTPLRSAAEADTDLAAPSGWTKKLNPTRGGRFEVVFVSPTGEEIKSKRSLTLYLKAHPGGPASSEFIWATGNTPRRSSRLSEKVKATDSSEDEKPAKRGRSSSSKKVKATESPGDEKPAKRGRPSGSKKGKKGKQEEAPAESEDHVDAEEAKGTDVEMKDADNAQEEKKESDTAQEEKKEAPVVDAAEKTEEAEVKTDGSVLPGGADAAEKTEEAEGDAEVSELPKGSDAAGKAEEAEVKTDVSELPEVVDAAEKTEEAEGNAEVSVLPSDVSAPVSEGAGKPAESEVAPLEVEETENGLATETKKEEADSTINPVTPPPVETNVEAPAADVAKEAEYLTDAPAAEAAKTTENSADAPAAQVAKAAENSADDAAHKDDQVNVDSNGQIQPGASTVKCT